MFKKTGNPAVEEIIKNYRDRSYDLSSLKVIKIDSKRFCAWCGEGRLHHGNQKYCTTACSFSAMASFYPQKEEGLNALLLRQNWKCNICQFDYMPTVETITDYMLKSYRVVDPTERKEFIDKPNWSLMKRLKSQCEKTRRPEVDHIIPIYKGGHSLGLDNHQAICYTCHKEKTKIDNAGPRKVDPKKEYIKSLKKNYDAVNNKLSERIRSSGYDNFSPDTFWIETVSMEELNLYIEYFEEKYSENSHVDFKQRLASYKQIRIDKLNKLDQNGTEDQND